MKNYMNQEVKNAYQKIKQIIKDKKKQSQKKKIIKKIKRIKLISYMIIIKI